jgi:hypothetical protein
VHHYFNQYLAMNKASDQAYPNSRIKYLLFDKNLVQGEQVLAQMIANNILPNSNLRKLLKDTDVHEHKLNFRILMFSKDKARAIYRYLLNHASMKLNEEVTLNAVTYYLQQAAKCGGTIFIINNPI